MKNFFVIFGRILFLILEVICAIVSALILVCTFCASQTLQVLGLGYATILLFITSILGIFNSFVTIYTFLKKEDD